MSLNKKFGMIVAVLMFGLVGHQAHAAGEGECNNNWHWDPYTGDPSHPNGIAICDSPGYVVVSYPGAFGVPPSSECCPGDTTQEDLAK